MTDHAANAQHRAGVLNAPIGEEQLRAHRADLGPLSLLDQRAHPVGPNDLRVVVQKEQKFSLGLGSPRGC